VAASKKPRKSSERVIYKGAPITLVPEGASSSELRRLQTKVPFPSVGIGSSEEDVGTKCTVADPRYTGRALSKGACPITIATKRGKPVLRFCTKHNAPGRIIPVVDIVDAVQKSNELCAQWRARVPANASAERYFEEARRMSDELADRYELGRVRRVRRRRRR
jgi:hypothetical protein